MSPTHLKLNWIRRHATITLIRLGPGPSRLCVLMSASRTLGWLLIASQRGPYAFGKQELRRYRTLAGQAAVALENRLLFQDVQARVNELNHSHAHRSPPGFHIGPG